MSSAKRFLWPVLLVALVAALAVGAWPRSDTTETNAQRTDRISGDIRCPTCSGLSVAESEAPLAQSARAEIAAQVAAGSSDEQIQAYFVDRYGNTALMSPPKEGITAWAWAAPIVLGIAALIGIAFAVRKWRRRARTVGSTMSDEGEALVIKAARIRGAKPPGRETREELDFLLDSLERLEQELVTGSIGQEEYKAQHVEQVTRAAVLIRAAETPPAAKPKRKVTTFRFKGNKHEQRLLWGGAALCFLVIAAVALTVGTNDRLAGDSSTGATAGDSNSLLARAAQQTADSKPADAIQTYDRVLRTDPKNAQALAYRGWLIRLAGLTAQGEQSIDAAIAADPTYPDARFFKGYILLRDKTDPAGAITQFDAFLANNPPAEMVSLVQQARADAVAQLSDPTVTPSTTPQN